MSRTRKPRRCCDLLIPHPIPSMFRQSREDGRRRPPVMIDSPPDQAHGFECRSCSQTDMSDNTQIFESSTDSSVDASASRKGPRRGTSGAHDIAIRREMMRITEIASPGQPTHSPYQPRSATPGHKTRPIGRLAGRLCSDLHVCGHRCLRPPSAPVRAVRCAARTDGLPDVVLLNGGAITVTTPEALAVMTPVRAARSVSRAGERSVVRRRGLPECEPGTQG